MAVFNCVKGIVRKTLRYHKSIRKEIKIVVGFFLIAWMIKVFLLNSIPAPFDFFPKLGDLFEKLCASIISSYVFYFFVVHWKAEQDKEIVNSYVLKKVQQIIDECTNQLNDFTTHTNGVGLVLENLNEADIKAELKKIHQNSNAPLILGYSLNSPNANWVQYMDYHNNRTKNTVDELLKKITLLDAEIVSCLAEIENCGHFYFTKTMLDVCVAKGALPTINGCFDMSEYAPSFFAYCVFIQKLNQLKNSKLAKYSKESN